MLLVSLELDEVLSLSDRILVMFEGEIVGEYGPDVSEEELGIAMTGGRRREATAHERRLDGAQERGAAAGAGAGTTEGPLDPQEEQLAAARAAARDARAPERGDYAPSVAARMALIQRAGGIVMPLVTTLFAFAMAMIVVAATGHNPFKAFRGIFNGTGLNWFFPWVMGDAPHGGRVQPPADADPDDRR